MIEKIGNSPIKGVGDVPSLDEKNEPLFRRLKAANSEITRAFRSQQREALRTAVVAAENIAKEIVDSVQNVHQSIIEEARGASTFGKDVGLPVENLKKLANMLPHSGQENPPQR